MYICVAITLIGKGLFAVRNICNEGAITNLGKFFDADKS